MKKLIALTHPFAFLKKKQSQQPSSSTIRVDGNDLVFTVDDTQYRYKMILVEGGSYTMGCTSEQCDEYEYYDEGGCYVRNEQPAHSVTVSGFYIGQTEVTQALWKAVMGNNPCHWKGNRLPVERVSYNDVEDFISKLNSKTSLSFRLPSEAEWEFAARGGNSSRGYKFSGSIGIGGVAWYDVNSDGKTHPVAQKEPNELGLYDMAGNVWEWCSDWYDTYSSGSQSNPKGPSSGSCRVTRGGSWYDISKDCRVSSRDGSDPSHRLDVIGFRLAR